MTAAKKIISLFPGNWEISQTYRNVGAQEFWLKLVQSMTDDKFDRIDLKHCEKIVLKFEI